MFILCFECKETFASRLSAWYVQFIYIVDQVFKNSNDWSLDSLGPLSYNDAETSSCWKTAEPRLKPPYGSGVETPFVEKGKANVHEQACVAWQTVSSLSRCRLRGLQMGWDVRDRVQDRGFSLARFRSKFRWRPLSLLTLSLLSVFLLHFCRPSTWTGRWDLLSRVQM